MNVSVELDTGTDASTLSVEDYINQLLSGNNNGSTIVLKYPKFEVPKPPIFINKTDQLLFYNNDKNLNYLNSFQSQNWLNHTRGEIHFIYNGSTHEKYDCGWFPSLSKYYSVPKGISRKAMLHITDKIISPLFVPSSFAFQEFLNGVLPKIVQIWPFILSGKVNLLLFSPRDSIIYELLQRIGVPKKQIIFQRIIKQLTHVSYQVNTCITPPLHPVLWIKNKRFTPRSQHPSKNIKCCVYFSQFDEYS